MRNLATAGAILLALILGLGSARADDSGVHDFLSSQPVPRVVEQVVSTPVRVVRALFVRQVSAPAGKAEVVQIVSEAARRHGVPEHLAIGVAMVESGLNPHARNGSAIGLMQVKIATARGLGCAANLYDARVNADCGARYLARTLARAHGDVRTAAALYNVGEFGNPRRAARYAALVLGRGRRAAT